MWAAPDGAGIVYATFDDSEVEEVQFEVYDSGGGDGRDGLYPGVSSMRYPKERRETDLKYRVFVEVNHSTLYCTP